MITTITNIYGEAIKLVIPLQQIINGEIVKFVIPLYVITMVLLQQQTNSEAIKLVILFLYWIIV